MGTIILVFSFMGLGALLGLMGFHALSSWEYWAIMGLVVLGNVGTYIQGLR